jgi:putative membrane protein
LVFTRFSQERRIIQYGDQRPVRRRFDPTQPVKERAVMRNVSRAILIVLGALVGVFVLLVALASAVVVGRFGVMRLGGFRITRGFEPLMFSGLGWGEGVYIAAMIIFWLFVGVGAFFLVKWLIDSGRIAPATVRTAAPGESTLDIIKRRYAAGEITKEQFDQMKQDLG